MKVGDYVRTECGIAKIENFETKNKEVINLDKDIMLCNMDIYRNCCTISQVIKSSPNIIDLIEVGDYVNGSKVLDIAQAPKKAIYTEKENGGALLPIVNNRIESVLTKEQFENCMYKTGE